VAVVDPRVADLVQAGRMRVGLFPPQYGKDQNGALTGPWVEIIRALAAHIGIAGAITELANPDQLVERLAAGTLDVGSLGFDPARAPHVEGFTPPFMRVEYTFLVPAGSAIASFADVDRFGIRIAVVRNHASTLALSRILQRAEPVAADTPDEAFALLRSGRADVWASIRPALLDFSPGMPGSRVMADSYGANLPALVVPKGCAARLAFLCAFVEQAKASGLARRAIEQAGQAGFGTVP
jgi:polar amino acid transport system substrate-binding protein